MEGDGVGVEFFYVDGLVADEEEIALGGADFFVGVDGEGEENVVGREGSAVGKADVFAEFEGVFVAGDGPGFGERGDGFLGGTIDGDEIGVEAADDVAGGSVERGDGVEGLGFGAEGDVENAAAGGG